ncbi:VWA domain-containing protein [Pseudoruegeria sp. HB172150]|uniref:VWA domain-containing protein n=1 Tax=Pseudoruegeria sp. HB172150 TaxID=2721164 RepID=UPI00155312F4
MTKLAFALDESGSVDDTEFDFIQNGLAAALAQLPTDSTYEVTVVAFSSGPANTVLSPTVIDSSATLAAVQTTIQDYDNQGGGTDIGQALTLIDLLHGDIGDTVGLVNVVTDGVSSTFSPEAAALAANGWDSLNFEAVTTSASTSVLEPVAFPGTVQVLNAGDALPNPLEDSFIIKVDTFEGFEAAIKSKVQKVIDSTDPDNNPSAVPLPASLPLIASGLGIFGFLGRRRKKSS